VTRQAVDMSRPAREAATVLGQLVRMKRAELGWTAEEAASRAGISARTVSLIERGSANPSLGNVLNLAVAVGVPLFGEDDPEKYVRLRYTGELRLALLPSRVYHPRDKDDDARFDF